MTAGQSTANGSEPPKIASREVRPLARRHYKAVTVTDGKHEGGGFRVLLDGQALRTPATAVLAVPTRRLAEALAAEWAAQSERIDPGTMPLTRLVNSAVDGIRGREAEVRSEIAKYAESDLLCYRADGPAPLVCRQAKLWDPVLAWGRDELGVSLRVAAGVMPMTQPDRARTALARALAGQDAFTLAALHAMTTLMGSALLALAHARGRLRLEEAWAAAHVDEDWQISQWGEDAEAAARRRHRWLEVAAASSLLRLLTTNGC